MTIWRRFAMGVAALLMLGAVAGACAAELKAGDAPPDYVGRSLDGEKVLLSQHAGKAVVISFWATWCPYCLKELPILSGIQTAGKGNIDVIAINVEERDVFRRVTRAFKSVNLELAYDPGNEAQKAWGVHGIPHLVIIGRDGKIAGVYRGYGEDSLPGIVDDINRATGAVQ